MARKPLNEPSLVPILTAPVPRGTSAHKPSFQRIRLSKPAAQTSARQQAHAPPAASAFTPLPFTTNESALSNFQRIAGFNQPSQLLPIPALANPLRQEVPQRQSFRRIKPTSSGTRRIKLKTSSPLQVVTPSRPSEVNSRRVSGESATPSLPAAPNGAAQRLRGRGPVGAQDDDLLHKDNALDNEENEDGIAGDSGAFFGNRVSDSLSGGDDGIQFIGSLSRPALSSTVTPASPKSPFVHTPTIPLTYYTTFTYYTTVIRGPHTAMLSRELVSSTTAVKPIDRSIVTAIEFSEGYIQPSRTQVPLGTKTKGQTTTIFNMASRVQVFNDDLYKVIYATRASSKPLEHTRILPLSSSSIGAVSSPESLPKVSFSSAAPSRVSSSAVRIQPTRSLFSKPASPQSRVPEIMLSKWEDLDSQPKRLLTKYTYFYTFIDGAQTRYSTRKEESTAPFKGSLNTMASALDSSIDSDGNLQILSPKSATVALGSRANGRMTTVVNLALKNYVQFDKVRDFQIKPTSVVASSPTLQTPTPSLTPSFEESPVVSSSVNRVSSEMSSSQLETPRLSSEILFKSSSVISTSATLATSSQLRTRPSQSRRPFRVKLKPLRSKLATISRVSNQLAPSSSPSVLEPWSSISSESIPSSSTLLSPSPSPALSSTQVPVSSTSIADPIASLSSVLTTPSATPTRKKVAYTVRRPVSGVNRYFNRRPSSYLVRSSSAFALPSSVFSTVSSFEYLSPSLASSSAVLPTVSYISSFSPQYISPSSTILESFSGHVSSPVFKPSKVSKSRFVVTRLAGNVNKWNPLYASRIRVSSRKVLKSTGVPELSSISIEPTSVVETIFETTLHTVPFTLGSTTIYTTLEEVHSRIVTRSEEQTEPSQLSPSFEPKVSTVKPTIESSFSASPTMSFETKTQLTTLTHFNTIYTSDTSIVTSSEQTLSSLVSVAKLALVSPTVIVETSDSVTTSTLYSTYTYFATLFNGTRTMITPLEEVKTEYLTLREPVTITRTIVPTMDIRPSSSMQPMQASRSVASIEPMFSAVQPLDGSFVTETYSTHTTLTHFITLFSGTRTILSSIEEVSPTEMTRTRMVLVTDSSSIGGRSSSAVESSRLSPLILEMASEPIKSASVGSVYSSSMVPSSSIQPSASLVESTRGSFETMSPSVAFSGVLFNKAQVDSDVASAMPTALVIGPSTTLVDERDSMSSTASIEPGSVIELNDLLQGVQNAGQIGETIKDIVNNIVTRPETTDEESATTTESDAEETTEPLTDFLVTTPMNVKVSTLAPSFNPSAEKTPSLNAIKKADAKFPVYVASQNLAKYKTSSEEKVIFSTQAEGNGEPGQPMSTRYVTSIEKSAKTLTLTKTQV